MYNIDRRSNGITSSIARRGCLAGYTTVWGAILDPITVKARGQERFGIKVRRGHDRQGITNGMTIYEKRSRRKVLREGEQEDESVVTVANSLLQLGSLANLASTVV